MKNMKFLKEIDSIISISSREKQAREVIKKIAKQYECEPIFDNLGSTFINIKSKQKSENKVMLSFPMDESGYMVRGITSTGEIQLVGVSNQTSVNLLGQILLLMTKEGKRFEGYTIFPKLDLKESSKNELLLKEEDCIVEFGFSSKEDAIKKGVNIGDSVVIKTLLDEKESLLITRGLDVKVSLYMINELVEAIDQLDLDFDVIIGGVVQEKVGYRGSVSATTTVQPSINISFAFESETSTYGCGSGVFIKTFDKTTLPNIDMANFITKHCNVHAHISDFGTSASFIHKSLTGVPSVVMGIHGRNIGLQTQMCHKDDIQAYVKEITKIVTTLSLEDINQIKGCTHYE